MVYLAKIKQILEDINLYQKLFISRMLEKVAADNFTKNWLSSKFKRDLRMSHQQMPQF